MGIILLASSVLPRRLLGLQRWWKGLQTHPAREPLRPPHRPMPGPAPLAHGALPRAARVWQGPVQAPRESLPSAPGRQRALRCHTGPSGRMVIAGRMADVCAELERLAAHEQRL
ncbi:hypothetical protein [Comamonas granuli]|uniref:hypothetical protein n=1 Tax=Comamonas granuli TaxID=290309 RepID=UPI0005A8FD1D|nr:hypothetical protein [Comamonas granuli]